MTNEEIQEIVAKADAEYDRLKDRVHEQYDEIKRLNNIINELEKWLESELKRLEKIQNPNRGVKPYGQEYNNYTLLIGAYDNALDKLRELKGVDKE